VNTGPGTVNTVSGTKFRASVVGFVLMTALVVIAATGVFILLDPRSAVFWAAKYTDLVGSVRGLLGR